MTARDPALARDLTTAMVRFGQALRRHGLPVTVEQLMTALRALAVVEVGDREAVRQALRAALVARREEGPAFDRCFHAFWALQGDGARLDGLIAAPPPEDAVPGSVAAAAARDATVSLEGWEDAAEDTGEPLEVPGTSAQEVLLDRDFASFPADQLDEVARVTATIARRLARRLSRRRRPVRRGGVVDLRRSIRANLMRGEIVELRRRERRRRKLRLILLCDVSGSMDLYSRFLLQFLYALQNAFGRVETFTFATRLTRVTEHLRGPSYRHALRRLTAVRDWAGGTRIGESLRTFVGEWGTLLDRHTVVIVLSDGWDTGEPEELAQAMLEIKRRAGRVIWLNPLLGNPAYEPLTRGMAAALPLVDRFAAAHNLASLRDLAGHLRLP